MCQALCHQWIILLNPYRISDEVGTVLISIWQVRKRKTERSVTCLRLLWWVTLCVCVWVCMHMRACVCVCTHVCVRWEQRWRAIPDGAGQRHSWLESKRPEW